MHKYSGKTNNRAHRENVVSVILILNFVLSIQNVLIKFMAYYYKKKSTKNWILRFCGWQKISLIPTPSERLEESNVNFDIIFKTDVWFKNKLLFFSPPRIVAVLSLPYPGRALVSFVEFANGLVMFSKYDTGCRSPNGYFEYETRIVLRFFIALFVRFAHED